MFFKLLDLVREPELERLIGKTITAIDVRRGEDREQERITFVAPDGKLHMFHSQDCCESVVIEDISGDLSDLIGAPILVAEERVADNPDPVPDGLVSGDDSNTWTFYTLRTVKGTVDIRWHGSSNGYYSESVSTYWEPNSTG